MHIYLGNNNNHTKIPDLQFAINTNLVLFGCKMRLKSVWAIKWNGLGYSVLCDDFSKRYVLGSEKIN